MKNFLSYSYLIKLGYKTLLNPIRCRNVFNTGKDVEMFYNWSKGNCRSVSIGKIIAQVQGWFTQRLILGSRQIRFQYFVRSWNFHYVCNSIYKTFEFLISNTHKSEPWRMESIRLDQIKEISWIVLDLKTSDIITRDKNQREVKLPSPEHRIE